MEKAKEKKVVAIIALVMAILGLVLSWVPIINNVAAVFALFGIVLGVIALLINRKNKKTMSLVSTILSILAIIIVLVTQSMYSKAVDHASKSVDKSMSSISSSIASSSEKTSPKVASKKSNEVYKVGDTVSQKNGVQIIVNKVSYYQGDELNTPDAGKQYVMVNVTLKNSGSKGVDYNQYDYKLDDNGNQTDMDEIVSSDENGNDIVTDELSSGTLQPGGSVTGTLVGQANPNDNLKLASVDYDNKVNWTVNLK
ncbi:MAG: DUF4190 domain-containing protein [Weissella confusa]